MALRAMAGMRDGRRETGLLAARRSVTGSAHRRRGPASVVRLRRSRASIAQSQCVNAATGQSRAILCKSCYISDAFKLCFRPVQNEDE